MCCGLCVRGGYCGTGASLALSQGPVHLARFRIVHWCGALDDPLRCTPVTKLFGFRCSSTRATVANTARFVSNVAASSRRVPSGEPSCASYVLLSSRNAAVNQVRTYLGAGCGRQRALDNHTYPFEMHDDPRYKKSVGALWAKVWNNFAENCSWSVGSWWRRCKWHRLWWSANCSDVAQTFQTRFFN